MEFTPRPLEGCLATNHVRDYTKIHFQTTVQHEKRVKKRIHQEDL
jgi:hypothetical protein